MRKEGRDFALAYFRRMALGVEEDKTLDPMNIGVLGANAQMTHPDSFSHALQEG
jgi:hypothetical protein